MSSRNGFTAAGVGAVACAACCAAPVLAVVTATGIATVAGFLIFGTAALVVGVLVAALILRPNPRKPPEGQAPVHITDRTTRP